MRPPVLAVLPLAAAALFAGCADRIAPDLSSFDIDPDSAVHFPVVGDTIQLRVLTAGENGEAVLPEGVEYLVRDTLVARVDRLGRVASAGDGHTWAVARWEGLADSVQISVRQARDSLVLTLPIATLIVSLAPDAPLPVSCRAFDAAGARLAHQASVVSMTGRIEGTACGALVARASGHDTLVVTAGPYRASLPVVIALRPRVLGDPAARFPLDSLPAGLSPWAPTLVRNNRGTLDLYIAGYREAPYPFAGKVGDLHRLSSADGAAFRYAGIALRRDPEPCALQSTGIENVAIVPRQEAAGWRMYFSAGSDGCYGWQVFSAVSDDELTWRKEAGIRVSNGGEAPPADPELPPWPAGEGMHVDRAGGEWRMLVGSYLQAMPRENRFQITEWHSADQVAWRYTGAVLTTREVGPGARRSVYSPSVQLIAPGLRRMFFSGDDLDVPSGGSRIYTAVSVDGSAWQVEGILLDDGASPYYYSTIVDDLLVFIRGRAGAFHLAAVRVEQR